MVNALNKCKCQIYKDYGGTGPEIKNGKRQKCKLPETILTQVSPLKDLTMMPIAFRVKACFWEKLEMIVDRRVNYEKYKEFVDLFGSEPNVKEALKGNITACNNMNPLPEVDFVERIPELKAAIDVVMGIEDFKKTQCMGAAFGKICEDVDDYNFKKYIDKLLKPLDVLDTGVAGPNEESSTKLPSAAVPDLGP